MSPYFAHQSGALDWRARARTSDRCWPPVAPYRVRRSSMSRVLNPTRPVSMRLILDRDARISYPAFSAEMPAASRRRRSCAPSSMRRTVASAGASSGSGDGRAPIGTSASITAPMSRNRPVTRPPRAGQPGQPGHNTVHQYRILATWACLLSLYIAAGPGPANCGKRLVPPTPLMQGRLCQVVELAVLHSRQECADLGVGVDQDGAGRMARVAHGDPAVRQHRYLDAVTARVAPAALAPGCPQLIGGHSAADRHRFCLHR